MRQETSLAAYSSIKHELSRRHLDVLNTLYVYGDKTNEEIADLLNVKINCITGRTNELVNRVDSLGHPAPLVEIKGHKVSKTTGRRVIVWGLVTGNQTCLGL